MRAAIVRRIGEAPAVDVADEPQPGRGQALVAGTAAAGKPLDLAIAAGRHYAGPPDLPYGPGNEGAGVVLASGSAAQGTRVRFESRAAEGASGSMAERAVV